MESDYKQIEAELDSLKSETHVCSSQLHEVENQLHSRRTELEQLVLRLVKTPVQTEKLPNKVCMCSLFSLTHVVFSLYLSFPVGGMGHRPDPLQEAP